MQASKFPVQQSGIHYAMPPYVGVSYALTPPRRFPSFPAQYILPLDKNNFPIIYHKSEALLDDISHGLGIHNIPTSREDPRPTEVGPAKGGDDHALNVASFTTDEIEDGNGRMILTKYNYPSVSRERLVGTADTNAWKVSIRDSSDMISSNRHRQVGTRRAPSHVFLEGNSTKRPAADDSSSSKHKGGGQEAPINSGRHSCVEDVDETSLSENTPISYEGKSSPGSSSCSEKTTKLQAGSPSVEDSGSENTEESPPRHKVQGTWESGEKETRSAAPEDDQQPLIPILLWPVGSSASPSSLGGGLSNSSSNAHQQYVRTDPNFQSSDSAELKAEVAARSAMDPNEQMQSLNDILEDCHRQLQCSKHWDDRASYDTIEPMFELPVSVMAEYYQEMASKWDDPNPPPALWGEIENIATLAEKLLRAFVPRNQHTDVTKKYWGAVYRIMRNSVCGRSLLHIPTAYVYSRGRFLILTSFSLIFSNIWNGSRAYKIGSGLMTLTTLLSTSCPERFFRLSDN